MTMMKISMPWICLLQRKKFSRKKLLRFRYFLPKSRKLDPAKNFETFNSRKFITQNILKLVIRESQFPRKKTIFTNFFELDWTLIPRYFRDNLIQQINIPRYLVPARIISVKVESPSWQNKSLDEELNKNHKVYLLGIFFL